MNTLKVAKLALLGGCAGGIETLALFGISLLNLNKCSLYVDFLLGGLFFIIVGIGIMTSFIISDRAFSAKKNKTLIIGSIGGFLSGLFFHFGIGLYIGIIIFSIIVGIGLRVINIDRSIFVMLGGMVGGIWGVVSSTFVLLLLLTTTGNSSIISSILSTALITFFINFGMLYAYKYKQ